MNSEATAEPKVHVGRKLYLVPLVLEAKQSPEGYNEKVETYWKEAAEHIAKLEARFGPVRKVYHESIAEEGEAALTILQEANPKAHRMIERKVRKGAEVVPIEDLELLRETVDWGRCLAIVSSANALRHVSGLYQEARRRRFELMLERINTSLKDDEAGLLIIGQEHGLQFPTDIQVFYVSPPSLDEIQRLLREHAARKEEGRDSASDYES